jgi:hypothetical protein
VEECLTLVSAPEVFVNDKKKFCFVIIIKYLIPRLQYPQAKGEKKKLSLGWGMGVGAGSRKL